MTDNSPLAIYPTRKKLIISIVSGLFLICLSAFLLTSDRTFRVVIGCLSIAFFGVAFIGAIIVALRTSKGLPMASVFDDRIVFFSLWRLKSRTVMFSDIDCITIAGEKKNRSIIILTKEGKKISTSLSEGYIENLDEVVSAINERREQSR